MMEVRFAARVCQELARFIVDERATTAVEYAIIASCVAVAVAATVLAIGTELRDNMYQKIINNYPS